MRSEIRQPQKLLNDDVIQANAFLLQTDELSEWIVIDLPTYIPDYSEGYADPVCNWG